MPRLQPDLLLAVAILDYDWPLASVDISFQVNISICDDSLPTQIIHRQRSDYEEQLRTSNIATKLG